MINIYLLSLAVSLGINLFFWLLASLFKTDKFTDFTYGLTFIILALLFLFKNQTFYPYQLILAAMIVIWGARLITYLFIRILKIKKDKRFDELREKPLQFLKFWFFQGISVWIIMLPSVYLLNLTKNKKITLTILSGVAVWILGLMIETISDWQKFRFKNNPKNKNLWIQSGLWKYSRHPNYFGEMLCWWGIFLFASPFLQGLSWSTILSPIFITFLLLFVTGVPPLEKRYEKKYAGNQKYQEYKRKTSLILPLPPRP